MFGYKETQAFWKVGKFYVAGFLVLAKPFLMFIVEFLKEQFLKPRYSSTHRSLTTSN